MKARLDSAPMTEEDVCIFAHGYRDCPIPPGLPDLAALPDNVPRPFYRGIVWGSSTKDDKRDADLMWWLGTFGASRWLGRRVRRAFRAYQGATVDPRTGGFVWLEDA